MSAAEIAQAIGEYAWPLATVVVLLGLRTSARTAGRIIRVCAWNWLLKRQGVPEARRRERIDGAAERDLKSS